MYQFLLVTTAFTISTSAYVHPAYFPFDGDEDGKGIDNIPVD